MQMQDTHDGDGEVQFERQTARGTLRGNAKSGKMVLYVRTKRVHVASRIVELPAIATLGSNITSRSKRVAIYEYLLNEDERAAVQNYTALARSLGIQLEIKDLAKIGILGRLLGVVFRNKLVSKTPSVSLVGEATRLLPNALD